MRTLYAASGPERKPAPRTPNQGREARIYLMSTRLAKTALKWSKIDHLEAYLRRVMYRQQISWWRRSREYAVAELPERPAGADATHDVELKIVIGRRSAG
jgi:hypothetical protein